MEGIISVKRYL